MKIKEEKKVSAKIISIVCTVLTVILVGLTCYVFVSIIISKMQNRPVNLFGVSFAVVLTNSMEPEIMTGDLIIFNRCGINEVSESDNIVFIAGDGFDAAVRGQSVVHKAINITEYGIQTKGVNNASADKDLVTENNFLGICTYSSAFLGAFFTFLLKYGILIIIALIAIPIIVAQVIKIIKLSKQASAVKAEGQNTEDTDDLSESSQ